LAALELRILASCWWAVDEYGLSERELPAPESRAGLLRGIRVWGSSRSLLALRISRGGLPPAAAICKSDEIFKARSASWGARNEIFIRKIIKIKFCFALNSKFAINFHHFDEFQK
jgi:hypothetical protein